MKSPLSFPFVTRLAVCLTLLLGITVSVQGQGSPPSGIFNYGTFEGTNAVWDLTGTYSVEQTSTLGEDPITIEFDFDLVQDAKGKLNGSGLTDIEFYGTNAAPFSILSNAVWEAKGGLKSGKSGTTARVKIQALGMGTFMGTTNDVVGLKLDWNLNIDTNVMELVGTSRGKAKADSLGSTKLEEIMIMQNLPAFMDGGWDLMINVAPDPGGKKLGGTGQVQLSNGARIDLLAKGSFNSGKNLSKIKLQGTNDYKAFKISLEVLGNSAIFYKMKGKGNGQKINYHPGP